MPVERVPRAASRADPAALGSWRCDPGPAPAKLDRLERVTDLVLVLLETPRPLTLDAIANQVPGYPAEHAARRQAFERDKRLLRDEGIPVLTERLPETTSTATGSTAMRSICPTWRSNPTSRSRCTSPSPAFTWAILVGGMR